MWPHWSHRISPRITPSPRSHWLDRWFVGLLLSMLTVGPAAVPLGQSQAADLSKVASEELALLREETVGIAVRHEQPISQAPSNVYVITDEDIRQSGATDIPTVLRRIPGLEVMQMSGADFNVSVRGNNQLQANKLLVMVDGRSIYLEGQGIVLWKLLPVTLPEIKRIEVLKGPASAVYGFNAFDGVINIITKSPEEMKGTTLQFGGGELGTLASAAIHADRVGKLGYRLSVGHDQNQQWQNRDALAFRADKLNALIEYELPGDSRVVLSGGLIDANRFDGPYVGTVINNSRPLQAYASASYERPSFFIRAWWTEFENTGLLTTVPSLANLSRVTGPDFRPVNDERNDVYNVDVQHAVRLWRSNSLTYGLNYRYIEVATNFLSQLNKQNRLGVFLQDEWNIAPKLNLVAGLRYDLHTEINPTVSPRVALLYNVAPDHTLRASFSVAYRPPTPLETGQTSFNFFTLPPPLPSLPPIVLVPSPNLKPEQILSHEIGYQGWFLKHRLRLRSDLFYNHISDLIFGALTSPTTAMSVNVPGQADIYGGEVGIEVLATHWLSGFANYSFQEIHQTITGEAARAGPRHKFNIGLRADWDNGLNGEIAFHNYGSVTYPLSPLFPAFGSFGVIPPDPRVGRYNLLNFRAGYRFWQQKAAAGYFREGEVAVSAFNALNDKHREHPIGEVIGSRVLGWVTLKF